MKFSLLNRIKLHMFTGIKVRIIQARNTRMLDGGFDLINRPYSFNHIEGRSFNELHST